jgi:hypothetical protein
LFVVLSSGGFTIVKAPSVKSLVPRVPFIAFDSTPLSSVDFHSRLSNPLVRRVPLTQAYSQTARQAMVQFVRK